MRKSIRVVVLLAFFALFLTATQSCDKQEDMSIEQTVKKSAEEMTWEEFVESLDLVEVYESSNSTIEGVTSSGSYIIVSSNPDLVNPPPYFDTKADRPHFCCTATVSNNCGGEESICCWAYNCSNCQCIDVIVVGMPCL